MATTLKDIVKNLKSGAPSSPIKNPGLGFNMKTQTLPNQGGNYLAPTPNMSTMFPKMSAEVAAAKVPPVQGGNRQVFTGGASAPAQEIPPQFIDPETGGIMLPEKFAANVANSIPEKARGGDIGSYAGRTLTEGPKTAEELQVDATRLNNTRNDIASGETDAMKMASKSGVAYSPNELKAIENAMAGIYDPALDSALAKLESKKKQDEDDRKFRNDMALLAQKHKYDLELESLKGGFGAGGSGDGEFAATVDMVANMEPTVSGKKSIKSQLRSLIDSKDYVSAYNTIANTVATGLVGEAKQRYENARTDYSVMQGLKEAIEKYAAAGGNMNILKGTEEEIKRKLGIDTPKASALATQLWREFQTYRNQMTGAAFGAGESRDYESVNPSLGKSLDLNLSVIQGAQDQLRNRVVSTIDTRIPSAKYIREYAEGATPGGSTQSATTVTAPDGTIIEIID